MAQLRTPCNSHGGLKGDSIFFQKTETKASNMINFVKLVAISNMDGSEMLSWKRFITLSVREK
jgi:hypothetical protein